VRRAHRRASERLWGCCLVAVGLFLQTAAAAEDVPVQGYRVVESWPHDTSAFTQGLVVVDGQLYESTGGYGRSTVRRVDLESGEVQQVRALPRRLFGEGLTAWRGELVQLTWRAGVGLRYERATLAQLGDFKVAGEGWGITEDGARWIISDGSAALRFLDPASGDELGRVTVRDGERPVSRLNELEMVPVPVPMQVAGPESGDGDSTRRNEVWANIWFQDRIVRIDPEDGRVLGYVDLTGLWPRAQRPSRDAVLNGIAWDADKQRLLVTGKLWPRLYWIEIPGLLPRVHSR
jgi:glutamine cyclotransferase